jgi:hypothetical protein
MIIVSIPSSTIKSMAPTNGVQIVIDTMVTCIRNLFHMLGDSLVVLFRQLVLQFLHALIIPLIPRFERTTVNQSRDKALSV